MNRPSIRTATALGILISIGAFAVIVELHVREQRLNELESSIEEQATKTDELEISQSESESKIETLESDVEDLKFQRR